MSRKKPSKYNATKHNIFTEILLSGDAFPESRQELLDLTSVVQESIRPQTALENALAGKLAALLFRLTRVYKVDERIAPKLFARVSKLLGRGQPEIRAKWVSPKDQIVVVRRDPTSESIMRYETNLERQIVRTLSQIETLRRMRRDTCTPALPPASIAETPNE